MTDAELVDQSYAVLSAEHHRHERTDRLLLASSLITFAVAVVLNQTWDGWWAPLLAGMSGLSAGTTLAHRRLRRHAFEQLTRAHDEYQRYQNAPNN